MVQAMLSRRLAEKGRILVASVRQDQGVKRGGDTFCSVSKSSICAESEEENEVDR